jgi:hypothetical protein
LDDRLFQARIHHGSLWTAHNIEVNSNGIANSAGGRDGVRWYEITNFTATPGLRQSGTLFDPAASNPSSYWIGTCAISGQGHVAVGCSVAGLGEHAEIAVAGRFTTDAPGTLQPPTVVQSSSSTYNLNDGVNPHRWGDFSSMSVDPNDDMTFWTVQEYCDANNSWAVRVVQLKAPPPARPTNCTPAIATAGATNLNIVVTGYSTNGSGFFEPGTNFATHLSASVPGGDVTVNGVVYNNPTNITLNISVAPGAVAGSRTITVTNPDGQNITSASGILSVVGGQPPSPVIQTITVSNSMVTITWSAVSNQIYRVQYNDDLTDTHWIDLAPDVLAGGSVASKTDLPAPNPVRFYRIRLVP